MFAVWVTLLCPSVDDASILSEVHWPFPCSVRSYVYWQQPTVNGYKWWFVVKGYIAVGFYFEPLIGFRRSTWIRCCSTVKLNHTFLICVYCHFFCIVYSHSSFACKTKLNLYNFMQYIYNVFSRKKVREQCHISITNPYKILIRYTNTHTMQRKGVRTAFKLKNHWFCCWLWPVGASKTNMN